jgi:hypothetical protein
MSGYTCTVLRLFGSVPREILCCDTALYRLYGCISNAIACRGTKSVLSPNVAKCNLIHTVGIGIACTGGV